MSEKINHSNEHIQRIEHHETKKPSHERELSQAEREHGQEQHIEHVKRQVEQHAVSGQERSHTESEQRQHPVLVYKQHKDMAFSRAMTRARKRLSASSRVFSKVIHAPIIDKSSEVVGKTIARPSGMLGGAFIAFAGTSALLWITNHYGYEYNYLVVLMLFAIGLVAGLAFEGLLKLIRRRQQQ